MQVKTDNKYYKEIADAIRDKYDISGEIAPDKMASKIVPITGGDDLANYEARMVAIPNGTNPIPLITREYRENVPYVFTNEQYVSLGSMSPEQDAAKGWYITLHMTKHNYKDTMTNRWLVVELYTFNSEASLTFAPLYLNGGEFRYSMRPVRNTDNPLIQKRRWVIRIDSLTSPVIRLEQRVNYMPQQLHVIGVSMTIYHHTIPF